MALFMRLAWRNLFRNKRRTIIAGSAIGIGLAALIFTDALIEGMEENMIATATSSFMGEGQIHRRSFRKTYDVAKTVAGAKELLNALSSEPIVRHYAPRVLAQGMISSAADVASILVVGVDPAGEKHLSQVDEAMIRGDYLDAGAHRSIVLGEELAEMLDVDVGDRVVITATQPSGELAQEMFRISGLYRMGIREMDRAMAFVNLLTAQQMLGLEGGIHEIALRFTERDIGRDRKHPFWKEYSQNDNEAIGWIDIFPQFETAFELSDFSTYITGLVLFGIVALVIINTLFMSLHERMFEFGVLRALGTRPKGMAVLVLSEAAWLAVVSIIVGAFIGLVITWVFGQVGIDYRGVEFSGVTMRNLLYPVLTPSQFLFYPLEVLLLTLAAAFYPAVHASRLQPAEAVRKSL